MSSWHVRKLDQGSQILLRLEYLWVFSISAIKWLNRKKDMSFLSSLHFPRFRDQVGNNFCCVKCTSSMCFVSISITLTFEGENRTIVHLNIIHHHQKLKKQLLLCQMYFVYVTKLKIVFQWTWKNKNLRSLQCAFWSVQWLGAVFNALQLYFNVCCPLSFNSIFTCHVMYTRIH